MSVFVCMYMYACICMHVCMYLFMCVCMCVYVCVCMYVYVRMYAYMYVCVCIIYWGVARGGKCPTQNGRGIVRGEFSRGVGLSYTRLQRTFCLQEIAV